MSLVDLRRTLLLFFVEFKHDCGRLFEYCAIAFRESRKDFFPIIEFGYIGQFRWKQTSLTKSKCEWNSECACDRGDRFRAGSVRSIFNFVYDCSAYACITRQISLRPIALLSFVLHPFTEVFSTGHEHHCVIYSVSFVRLLCYLVLTSIIHLIFLMS